MTACIVTRPAILPVFGTEVEVFLDASRTNGHYTAYRCTVPPQAGPPPHRHDFDEAFYILEGTLQILCGDERHTATVGTYLFVPRGTPHTFKNTGDSPARYLGTATPAGHEEFFLDAAQIEGPLTPELAVAVCERNGIELLF